MSGPSMPSMTTGPSRPGGEERGTSAPQSSADTPVTRRVTPAGGSIFLGARLRPCPAPTPQMPSGATLPPGGLNRRGLWRTKAVVLIEPQNRAGEVVWPAVATRAANARSCMICGRPGCPYINSCISARSVTSGVA